MLTKTSFAIVAVALSSTALANTPKIPQSPAPNVEATQSSPVGQETDLANTATASSASAISAPSDLTMPQKADAPVLSIEKNLPDQTVAEQLAAKKSAQQKLAAQKAQAQRITNQKAAAQRLAVKKEAALKLEAQKLSEEKSTKQVTPTLGNVSTEVEGDLTIITARLNTKPDWKELALEEHGTFLQIKLPGTIIPASGEFIDGNGPFLKKIATFQVSDSDGAIRLFVNQDGSKAKLATTAELLGDRVVVTIDHKKLEQLITPTAKPKADVQPLVDNTNKVTGDTNPVNPADLIAAAGTTNNEGKAKTVPVQHLYNRLTKVAAFCAVLFLTFLAVQFMRSKKRKTRMNALSNEEIEPATLKILSTINLGQKQRLSLVQVGSQQVLLGVSADSINMLTTIESRQKVNFATQLQMANPNAEIRLKAPEDVPPPRPQRRTLPTTTANLSSNKNATTSSSSINIAIDDEGPRVAASKSSKKEDDITRMLRDRLRNLPPG